MLRPPVLFVLVCLLWGATWIALKAGLAVVPPLLFAGTRFVAAGVALLVVRRLRGESGQVERTDWLRLAAITVMMISVPYGLLFWGTQFVSSGLSAVLNLALMPVALLSLGALFGEARFTPVRAVGVAVGVAGLLILFAPKVFAEHGASGRAELLGGAAIVLGSLCYALASVMGRPLLLKYSAMQVAATTMTGGGAVLMAVALALEPGARAAMRLHWGTAAWLGWLFLVLFGSLVAFTAYLELVRRWGNARAGAYAFVSPIVAVALGVLVFGETVGPSEAVGMAVMVAGAWLTLRPAPETAGAKRHLPGSAIVPTCPEA